MKELESLPAFWERISGFTYHSLPHSGGFWTNGALPLKVGADGSMQPFMGCTVVFPLPEAVRRELSRMQERLYQTCAPALAEPLAASSFHMTLHDLLSGKPSQELAHRIGRVREPALECVRKIAERRETVRLRSTALFNMVGASMVLGFAPADGESCRRLMTYYEMLQEIVRLDYPLTPHVTTAYFRPGEVTAELTEKLRAAAGESRRMPGILMELSVESLVYQSFSDMNHYQ